MILVASPFGPYVCYSVIKGIKEADPAKLRIDFLLVELTWDVF
jgi:hypothetical protein